MRLSFSVVMALSSSEFNRIRSALAWAGGPDVSGPYDPRNVGGRRSRKARGPSFASSLAHTRRRASSSAASAVPVGDTPSAMAVTASFDAATESGALAAIVSSTTFGLRVEALGRDEPVDEAHLEGSRCIYRLAAEEQFPCERRADGLHEAGHAARLVENAELRRGHLEARRLGSDA